MADYKIALLCNAYSTNSECFTLPMGALVETIYGNGSMKINLPGTNCMASGSVTPLPMNLLDSLTVHAKMRYVFGGKKDPVAKTANRFSMCVLSLRLQSDPQHRHAGHQVGPRQVQQRPGTRVGGNVQPTAGLYGD